jgi:molybdopterin synthase sulfur carrier subunit
VTLVYFAWVRQKIGVAQETIEPPPGVETVGDLIEHLRQRGGGYLEAFADTARIRAAVNQEHAKFDAPVSPEDEIAFFPPVTGG